MAVGLTGDALAAVPLVLPPGEDPAVWQAAARLTGFELRADPGRGGVKILASDAGWTIVVLNPDGGERRVAVAHPRSEREREDLLWVAASLATPLDADAPSVPRPPPRSPILEALEPPPPPPPKSPPPREAPAKSPPAPVTAVAPPAEVPPGPPPEPAPQPPPEPVALVPAVPEPPPEEAELPPQPGAPLAPGPLLTSGGALGFGLPTDGGPGALDGRWELAVGVHLGDRWRLALDGALVAPTDLELLGDTQSSSRVELGAELGLSFDGPWRPYALLRAGAGRLRFTAGEPAEKLGNVTVPLLGLRAGVDRPLRAGFGLVVGAGLDRDLASVLVDKEGSELVVELPQTRIFLEAGISWRR